jgi:hypothetical protein
LGYFASDTEDTISRVGSHTHEILFRGKCVL